jgi:hypothetical protein
MGPCRKINLLVLLDRGSSVNTLETEPLGTSEYYYAENELLFRKTSAGFGQEGQKGGKTEAQARGEDARYLASGN